MSANNSTTNTAARELPSNDHLRLHLGEMTAQEMRTAKAAYRLALAENLTQQQGGEQEARELLAAEYERDGFPNIAKGIRQGEPLPAMGSPYALRAIVAALRSKQPAASEG